MSAILDPSLTPARPDLAAAFLRGRVEAKRFVEGRILAVGATLADVRRHPQPDAPLDTQALHGERLTVYDIEEGWAWGQLDSDGYVGYLPAADLVEPSPDAPTHRIAVLRSFLFPGPNIKLPPLGALPLGARVKVLEHFGDFFGVEGGFLWARHLVPTDGLVDDFVATAERFIGVPYLWGGKTALGLDCSGLAQVSLASAGLLAPRDSGPQERDFGTALEPGAPLRRGDLVFWRGHVGLMRDAETLLHANGYTMTVTFEPLAEAVARIAASGGGPVTRIKRV